MPYISKHFTLKEVECHCACGFDQVSRQTLLVADAIRDWLGKPVRCSSGCRCVDHNKSVGGAPRSRHLPRAARKAKTITVFEGDAMDLHVDDPKAVADWLKKNKPDVSYGVYANFIHIDTRKEKKTWAG